MKAVVLEKPGQLRIVDTDLPREPKPAEASVRVRRVGICGTDLHAFQGNQPFFQYPRILGHELGVEIVAVGENAQGLTAGDRCALEPYFHCGQCIACRRGKTNCCVNLKVFGVHIDGGMREQVAVPIVKLHKSATLSMDQLALVETLSIGAHAVERAAPAQGETALIVGVGPIGLSVAQFARCAGVEVIIMDISDRRLEFCRDTLRIAHCLDGKSDPLPQLRQLLGGDLPTLVFDCTGNSHSMHSSFNYVAHGGKLIFVGLFMGDVTFHDPDFHRREMTLLSSRNATSADFRRVIEMLETGRIDITPWITHRVCFSDLIHTFPQWADVDNAVLKAVVEW